MIEFLVAPTLRADRPAAADSATEGRLSTQSWGEKASALDWSELSYVGYSTILDSHVSREAESPTGESYDTNSDECKGECLGCLVVRREREFHGCHTR